MHWPATEVSLKQWSLCVDLGELALKAAVAAIGGIWAWNRFFRSREGKPRADVALSTCELSVTTSGRAIRVSVAVKNTGTTLFKATKGEFFLLDLTPAKALPQRTPDGLQLEWPRLGNGPVSFAGSLELEPGESDIIHVDFVVPTETTRAIAYAYLANDTKGQKIGWRGESVIEIPRTLSVPVPSAELPLNPSQ